MSFLNWIFGNIENKSQDDKVESISNKHTIRVDFSQLDMTEKCAYDWDFQLEVMKHKKLHGNEIMDVPLEVYNAAHQKMMEQKALDEQIHQYAHNNNEGMSKEKEGDLLGAIDCYKRNFESERYKNNAYPYERVIILYRKLKDYNNEIDVITLLLSRDIDNRIREKYMARLDKVKNMI